MIDTILFIILVIIIWECLSSGTVLYLKTKDSSYLFLPVTGILLAGVAVAVRMTGTDPAFAAELGMITGIGILAVFLAFVIFVLRKIRKSKILVSNDDTETENTDETESPENESDGYPHTAYLTVRIDYETLVDDCPDDDLDATIETVMECAKDAIDSKASRNVTITNVTNCGESV